MKSEDRSDGGGTGVSGNRGELNRVQNNATRSMQFNVTIYANHHPEERGRVILNIRRRADIDLLERYFDLPVLTSAILVVII